MRARKPFRILLATLLAAAPFGLTQAATNTAQESANMKVVADFYAALDAADAKGNMKQQIRSIAEKYLQPDYHQHMEAQKAYGPGREGFIKMFEGMPAMPLPLGAAPPPPKILALVGNGDIVIRVSARTMPGQANEMTIFNMFRVKDGKLAEHWDSSSGGMGGPPPGGPPGGKPPGGMPPGGMPPGGMTPGGPPPGAKPPGAPR